MPWKLVRDDPIILLDMLWFIAVLADEYMPLYPLQSIQLFANCCQYYKIHILGVVEVACMLKYVAT